MPDVPPSPETRRDVAAALGARRELGPEYDEQIAAGLAERVDELVALRMADARLAREDRTAEREDEQSSRVQRFVLGIVSIGGGIPISAIAGSDSHGGVVGLTIAWAGIVGVNLAAAWRGRRRS